MAALFTKSVASWIGMADDWTPASCRRFVMSAPLYRRPSTAREHSRD